ncbi:mandelate racemase/muconate lactonizing enzyme family protein [bacterium]|nr:mandelate racemase/muconate lactonizing enzyme family protein [bacterium]RQV99345.1 MAG: mandelate racemase/muconate lactonizing enzyme family protein [bacterium]
MSRRSFFIHTGAATAAVAALGGFATNDDYEAIAQNVNTNSQPSELKITDLRIAGNIIRIDTNQGISGYGEIRDGSSPTYALMLKSRILGENPCNVDKIWRKLKQWGYHARQSAGPVSIEMACWDLAGKAWGVPCWQMLGGKFRDKVLLYADTPRRNDPVEMGNRLKERMARGFKFLKMDFGIEMLRGIEGTITAPPTIDPFQQWSVNTIHGATQHPFTGIRLTNKGLDFIADWCQKVRDTVGWEVPIATDHYGHMILEDQIKMAQKLDQFNFAWYEDMVPWWYTDMYIRLKNACTTPILTGEDIYCLDGFRDLIVNHAVSIIHPDLATSGGLLETKKIGDFAQEHGISMAMHMAGSVVTWFSSIHCAAATENFLVMEHHGVDNPNYEDPVANLPKPIFKDDGYVTVPDGPGLGIEIDEEAIQIPRGRSEERFAPTPEWDDERSHDRLWSMYIQEKKETEAIISQPL